MTKIIIRDKLKFRIFPKIIWIDNEKKKLKANSEITFETKDKYVILSEGNAKKRRLELNIEDKKEILIEIKYDFFRLITIFLIIPILAGTIKVFLLSEVGYFAGIFIVLMWNRDKIEVIDN